MDLILNTKQFMLYSYLMLLIYIHKQKFQLRKKSLKCVSGSFEICKQSSVNFHQHDILTSYLHYA